MFRAIRSATGDVVVVRTLRISVRSKAWRRLRNELHTVVGIGRHPALATVHEVVNDGGHAYVVSEYVPGGSLADLRVRRPAPLSTMELVTVGEQLSSALSAAHVRGIAHLAVTADNVLVDAAGRVKLVDLGLAPLRAGKRTDRRPTTSDGLARLEAAAGVDGAMATDIEAFGVLLGGLLDDPPATAPSDGAQAGSRDQLRRLVERCVAVVPSTRPTAQTVHTELAALRAGLVADEPHAVAALAVAPQSQPAAARASSPTAVEEGPTPRVVDWRDAGVVLVLGLIAALGTLALFVVRDDGSAVEDQSPDETGAAAPTTGLGPQSEPSVPSTPANTVAAPPASPPATDAAVVPPPTTSASPSTSGSSASSAAPPTRPTSPPSTSPTTPATARPLAVGSATASEVRDDGQDSCGNTTRYAPSFAVDATNDTAWVMEGDGVGESLTLTLPRPTVVTEVGLVPGYDKSDPCTGAERFDEMRRITAVRWTFDDGTAVEQRLEPEPQLQTIELTEPATTTAITMTVLDTTSPGSGLDYTAVSEVHLAGAPLRAG